MVSQALVNFLKTLSSVNIEVPAFHAFNTVVGVRASGAAGDGLLAWGAFARGGSIPLDEEEAVVAFRASPPAVSVYKETIWLKGCVDSAACLFLLAWEFVVGQNEVFRAADITYKVSSIVYTAFVAVGDDALTVKTRFVWIWSESWITFSAGTGKETLKYFKLRNQWCILRSFYRIIQCHVCSCTLNSCPFKLDRVIKVKIVVIQNLIRIHKLAFIDTSMMLSIEIRMSAIGIISPIGQEEQIEVSCWWWDSASKISVEVIGEPLGGSSKVEVPACNTFSEFFSSHEAVSDSTWSSHSVLASAVLEWKEIPVRCCSFIVVWIESKLVRLIWVVLMTIKVINTLETSSSETHRTSFNHFIASFTNKIFVKSFSFRTPSACKLWKTKID